MHGWAPKRGPDTPLCTASEVVEGGCRFGGDLFLGNVNASRSQQF